jgi:hypothetical protein
LALNGCRIPADGFTKGWIWGAAAHEKNGSTTSKRQTVSDVDAKFVIRETQGKLKKKPA